MWLPGRREGRVWVEVSSSEVRLMAEAGCRSPVVSRLLKLEPASEVGWVCNSVARCWTVVVTWQNNLN